MAGFTFADLAALLFAKDREARDADAVGLRLRVEVAPAAGLLFFATGRDDFLFAFFRAAMAIVLHAREFVAAETNTPAQNSRLLTQFASVSALQGAKGWCNGRKDPINKPFSTKFARNQR
ncbi:MAG TPA: hypothetical protein VGH40_06360 [Roseiarcus sp.]